MTLLLAGLLGLLFAAGAPGQLTPEDPDAPTEPAEVGDFDDETNPLRPADTSSPRATLLGFIEDADHVLEEWSEEGDLEGLGGSQAYARAVSALDFSTTPAGHARRVQTKSLVLLRAILDRVELPSEGSIPGAEEIAEEGLTAWTLPGTSLAIERVASGPRAGEFLFSPHTVQRLDRYYRKAMHLPYLSDARQGVYEAFLRSRSTGVALEEEIQNRLRPVDMSSPRSTLLGFLQSVNRAHAIVMEADAALRARPPTMTQAQARRAEAAAQLLMNRAIATLDLTEVPEALRDDVGMEGALQLKEIFDRMNLPPVDFVPDIRMVATERERLGRLSRGVATPVLWRYPNTPIEIVETLEGEHQGDFRFSAESVVQLDDFYDEVRGLPYREESRFALDYPSPGTSEGFYEYYISTPGSLIPRSTALGAVIDSLPRWTRRVYFEQRVWQWIGLVLVVLAIVVLGGLVRFVVRRLARRLSPPRTHWLRLLTPSVLAVLFLTAVDFVDNDLNMSGSVQSAVTTGFQAAAITLAALVSFRAVRAIAETVISLPHIAEEGIDASLLRLTSSVLGAVLFAWILGSGLSNLGLDMVPLVAGLGVGGLAVALAARPTMENLIGSFMIFADKPYRRGQRIKVLGHDGVVEAIGLRSTKIRLLNGHATSIPNEKMASVEIENVGRRPYIRRRAIIQMPSATPVAKVKRALEIVRETLTDHEGMRDDYPPRIGLRDINDASIGIFMMYWYHPPDYWDYLAFTERVNLQLMERFEAEEIPFAAPALTLRMADEDEAAQGED